MLKTVLQEVNTEDINITTLEDPVEVIIEGINQIALNKIEQIDFKNDNNPKKLNL